MVEKPDSSRPNRLYLGLTSEQIMEIAAEVRRVVRIASIETARLSRELNQAAEDRANKKIVDGLLSNA